MQPLRVVTSSANFESALPMHTVASSTLNRNWIICLNDTGQSFSSSDRTIFSSIFSLHMHSLSTVYKLHQQKHQILEVCTGSSTVMSHHLQKPHLGEGSYMQLVVFAEIIRPLPLPISIQKSVVTHSKKLTQNHAVSFFSLTIFPYIKPQLFRHVCTYT